MCIRDSLLGKQGEVAQRKYSDDVHMMIGVAKCDSLKLNAETGVLGCKEGFRSFRVGFE